MSDPRYDQLARNLTGFSTRLQPGDRVLLDCFDIPEAMTVALIRAVRAAGALPLVAIHQARVTREMLREAEEAQYKVMADLELARMKEMQAYIAVRGSDNITEMSDVPGERMNHGDEDPASPCHGSPRASRTRWCVLRWPTAAMAQQAGMSTEAFEDFLFPRLHAGLLQDASPAWPRSRNASNAPTASRSPGPGTDLRFSASRASASIVCGGSHNIPDGEVFTCPVRDSACRATSPSTPRPSTRAPISTASAWSSRDGKVGQAPPATPRTNSTPVPRFRRRRALHRRVLSGLQSACASARCATFSLTRKSAGQLPLHARPGLRRRRQRQQAARFIGTWCQHPAAGLRRRRHLFR